MKASELRIGNLVQHKHGSSIIEAVVEPHLAPEFWKSIEGTYEGIPLTEEWVGRLGFDKDGRLTLSSNDSGENWFDVDTIQVNGDDESPEWGYEFSMNNEGLRQVRYVHELQNLYFALTGEELTIDNNV